MMKKCISIILMIVFAMSITVSTQSASITASAISGTKGANSGEEFSNILDRNASTKWCVTSFDGAYGMWKMSSAVAVTGYTICTANDNSKYTGRNPASWKLYGCNSSSTPSRNYSGWNLISSVSNDTNLKDVNYTTYDYTLKTTASKYQYYKLEITKTRGAKVMQIAEFTLNYSGSTKFKSSSSSVTGSSSSSSSGSSSSSSSSSSGSSGSWGSNRSKTCNYCGGSGKIKCTTCGGKGYWTETVTTPHYGGLNKSGGTKTITKTCPYCSGGYKDCPFC